MEVFQRSPFIYSNYKTSDWQERRAGKECKTNEELEVESTRNSYIWCS